MKISVYFLFFCFLLLISIVYSKFLLTVSIMAIFGLSIYKAYKDGFKTVFKGFISTTPLVVITLFFFIIFLSGINSENIGEWLHQVKMKLPYLTVPFSLWVFRDVVRQYYLIYHQLFISIIVISSLPILYFILNNSELVTELLGKGQSIDTPVDHIKYSLFVCFAAISSFLLAFRTKKETEIVKIPQFVYLILSLYLFIFLHFLAVRSGLVLIYIVGFLAALNEIRLRKSILLTLPLLALLISIPIASYYLIPNVHTKVGYMIYDIEQYRNGNGSNYSDSERIHSIKAGLQLFKQNKLMGTGIGDLKTECSELMAASLGRKTGKYPHNQYIFTLSGMGLIGFSLFLIAFFFPWKVFIHQESLFIFLAFLLALSFLVENTLERSYSIAFFTFFYCSGILKSIWHKTNSSV